MVQSPPGRPTVYLVDDDPAVRRALTLTLDLDGFAVATYASGEALLQDRNPVGPGCLVLDERLPGASGLNTLRQLRARGVDLPAILVTSHPNAPLREAAARAHMPIIEKPLMDEALAAAIRELLHMEPSADLTGKR